MNVGIGETELEKQKQKNGDEIELLKGKLWLSRSAAGVLGNCSCAVYSPRNLEEGLSEISPVEAAPVPTMISRV